MDYQEINSKTIDRWVDEGWEWGIPIDHETYLKALSGEWNVLLTPTKSVPHKWFGDLRGKKILGLASGGGQQMPVFAALGAECTVLDYSGIDNNINYLVDEDEERIINNLPFDPLSNPEQMKQLVDADCGVQFSHSIEEQIGGQLEAGFMLTGIYEDTNGEGRLHDLNIATFYATSKKSKNRFAFKRIDR